MDRQRPNRNLGGVCANCSPVQTCRIVSPRPSDRPDSRDPETALGFDHFTCAEMSARRRGRGWKTSGSCLTISSSKSEGAFATWFHRDECGSPAGDHRHADPALGARGARALGLDKAAAQEVCNQSGHLATDRSIGGALCYFWGRLSNVSPGLANDAQAMHLRHHRRDNTSCCMHANRHGYRAEERVAIMAPSACSNRKRVLLDRRA